MNQLATTAQYWTLATETDIQRAMTVLSGLPTRAMASEEVEAFMYETALKGVTKYGLEQAVERILQGGLGHSFMPSPPELRMKCDEVMRPIRDAHARDKRDREIHEGMARDAHRPEWTPESRARASALWAGVRAKQQAADQASSLIRDDSPEAAKARLEAIGGEGCLDHIRNSPVSSAFQQVGKARAAANQELQTGTA